MSNILVRPQELKIISVQLQISAQKIGVALQAIDQEILSLKGDRFLGNRANAMQAHYAPKREALLKAKKIVAHFAGDLNSAASTFEQADNQAFSNSTGAVIATSSDSSDLQGMKNRYRVLGQEIQDSYTKLGSIIKDLQDIKKTIGEGAVDQFYGLLNEILDEVFDIKNQTLKNIEFMSDIRKLIDDPVNFTVDKLLGKLGEYLVKNAGYLDDRLPSKIARLNVYLLLNPGRYSLDTISGSVKGWLLAGDEFDLRQKISQLQDEHTQLTKQILEQDPNWNPALDSRVIDQTETSITTPEIVPTPPPPTPINTY